MPSLKHPALGVAIASGTLGFWLGAVNFPDWQVAVETAQVTAGLVSYPPGNPTYVYHVKLWTVLHHVCALLLRAGIQEIALSRTLSGVLGMLSFQALAMVAYALGRSVPLAVAAAVLVFFSGATDYFGPTYPIYLLGTSHTYGVVGLSLLVLVAALFGAGCGRTPAFLLGVAPSVHPSLGLWLGVAVAASILWEGRGGWRAWRPLLPFFAAGCAVTVVSLAVQVLSMPDLPDANSAQARQYIDAFIRYWDGHRQGVHLPHGGVKLNVAALGAALIWLTAFGSDLPRERKFLLRFLAVSAALSLMFAIVSRVPASRLPTALVILMPTRLLNVNGLAFAAMLLGLLMMYRRTICGAVLLPLVALGLALARSGYLWRPDVAAGTWFHGVAAGAQTDPLTVLLGGMAALTVCVAVARWTGWGRRAGGALTSLSWIATAIVAAAALAFVWPLSRPTRVIFRDRTNSSVFYTASQRDGLLLTGGNLPLAQLRSRRPVLLPGGGLDGLAYAMESAVGMRTILLDVYGVDLLDPPEEALRTGTIPNAASRAVWDGYTLDRWREIRREYGVTQVLTWADWRLDLPLAARDPEYALYDIPE